MDTSEAYMEMCNCPEIQEDRKYNDGDVFYRAGEIWICGEWRNGTIIQYEEFDIISPKSPEFVSFDGGYEYDTIEFLDVDDTIWLPRQDQLQEMLPNEPAWDYRFSAFSNWLDIEPGLSIFNSVDSMEQLWLAFIIYKLHKKKWDEEEWVES